MCLGIPFKVIQIKGMEAVGEANGLRRSIRMDLLQDVNVGDFVMVHAGFALERLEQKEAEETLGILLELEEIRR